MLLKEVIGILDEKEVATGVTAIKCAFETKILIGLNGEGSECQIKKGEIKWG